MMTTQHGTRALAQRLLCVLLVLFFWQYGQAGAPVVSDGLPQLSVAKSDLKFGLPNKAPSLALENGRSIRAKFHASTFDALLPGSNALEVPALSSRADQPASVVAGGQKPECPQARDPPASAA